MKKTLIALAAFAATAGVAHAQSSVTMYGIVDAYAGEITTERVGASPISRLSKAIINSGGMSASRWGMRGAEDLGGGLAAVFTLETGFSVDTGVVANTAGNTTAGATSTLFGREASVGLKGNFGEVRLGRQVTPMGKFRPLVNNTQDADAFSPTGTVWGTGIQDYSSRANNAIVYTSPFVSGFSGMAMYGFGEDKTATTNASSMLSLHVKYADGPLLVGYAFQREKEALGSTMFSGANGGGLASGTVGTPAAIADTRTFNYFAGTYDFGVVKLVGGYNIVKNDTLKDKEYQFGVTVPFGVATLNAGYAHTKSKGAGVSNEGSGYSLLGTYNLSKRTNLYAAYRDIKGDTLNHTRTNKTSAFGVGIRHIF